MGLNLAHQNPAGIKKALQGAWEQKGCIDAKINDDGTINFYFVKEYQLMAILENAPYNFRGWMRFIEGITLSKVFGRWWGTSTSEISLVRKVHIMNSGEPVELEFKYKKLQKFCTTCGSLRHNYDACPKSSTLSATAGALMEIGNDPFITSQERMAAIEGLNTRQDIGESSGTQQEFPPMLAPISEYLLEHGLGPRPASTSGDVDMTSVERGTKRKVDEADLEVTTSSSKRPFGSSGQG
ncbi:unnamed protein product [Arabis nemorensis]|uniref:Zinc knuckle CX2CX4HX4C domain-containing protein n=1 Tax=Arabis nemorensis TaxID=586526 RepID=A0A565BUB4_9BRAS|nr:unnamed protein product [Arabis nemorensis]